MTGDRTTTDPEADKVQPAGASRAEPAMADLSRRLGEQLARQRAVDPDAAAAARRAALQAYDQARERRLIAALSVGLAVTVCAALAYFVSTIDSQPTLRSPSAAANPQPAPSPGTASTMASVAPEGAPPSPAPSTAAAPEAPAPATRVADPPAVEAASVPAADSAPAPVEAPPSKSPLQREDVREIQAKLRSFGFNPGPVDGTTGRLTEGAVRRYQQDRGQPQTGEIDRALLEQLRRDPAPPVVQQVAQRAARPDARSSGGRRADPFEPVRAAGNRFGRWLDSLTR
jgi:hypothetical protein